MLVKLTNSFTLWKFFLQDLDVFLVIKKSWNQYAGQIKNIFHKGNGKQITKFRLDEKTVYTQITDIL